VPDRAVTGTVEEEGCAIGLVAIRTVLGEGSQLKARGMAMITKTARSIIDTTSRGRREERSFGSLNHDALIAQRVFAKICCS